jgi:hypothetical protein
LVLTVFLNCSIEPGVQCVAALLQPLLKIHREKCCMGAKLKQNPIAMLGFNSFSALWN